MTKQEAIQEQIDSIMDTFDFEKVHQWMSSVNWAWKDFKSGEIEIPDTVTLRQRARELLKAAAKTGYCSTGGFTASRTLGKDEDGPWIKLHLSFGYSTCHDGTSYVYDGVN